MFCISGDVLWILSKTLIPFISTPLGYREKTCKSWILYRYLEKHFYRDTMPSFFLKCVRGVETQRLKNSTADLQLSYRRRTICCKFSGNITHWSLQQLQKSQRLAIKKKKLPQHYRPYFWSFPATRRMDSYYEEERNPREWKRWWKELPKLETTESILHRHLFLSYLKQEW